MQVFVLDCRLLILEVCFFKEAGMERLQVNFRLDKESAEMLDEKRVALMKEMGRIPTRSEVFRLALDQYLGRGAAPAKSSKRKASGKT